MITDSQFEACRLAANESYKRHKGSVRGQIITPEDDWEWHFARELIALAQQVKPLEWELNCAKSPFGRYFTPLHRIEDMYSVWRDGCFVTDQMFYTETAARAAAQQDYRKRVLSNLVHGGTNDTK